MSKFRYLKISKTKKLRCIFLNTNSKLFVVFLHGFMSDLEGEKPKAFQRYCKKRKLGFLALEYSGHGKSSGKFTKGNVSKWTKEIKYTIKKIVKKNNRSEEHTSELQSRRNLVCRLLLEKKNNNLNHAHPETH